MTTKPVPSLSDKGWITNPNEKLDQLMTHWMESEQGQTYIDAGEISNFQYLKYKYIKDMPGLALAIQSQLEVYLGKYFDSSLIDVRQDSADISDSGVTIKIYAEVTENNIVYSMGAAVRGANTKFHSWVKLNNG